AAGDGFEGAGVASGTLDGLVVPCGEVGDADPGGDSGPALRVAGGHHHGHVATAGFAGQVDARRVDGEALQDVGDGVEDVLLGKGGSAGVGVVVDAAEVGLEEVPV